MKSPRSIPWPSAPFPPCYFFPRCWPVISLRAALCAWIRSWRCVTSDPGRVLRSLLATPEPAYLSSPVSFLEPSRLLLFKEATETFYGVYRSFAGILCTARPETGGTAQLRFEHAGSEAADVRNKFWIGGGTFDLERHGRPALAAAACRFTSKSANAGNGACHVTEHAGERGSHFEIKIVPGIDRARAG